MVGRARSTIGRTAPTSHTEEDATMRANCNRMLTPWLRLRCPR
jgi:hypothetical protein